MKVENRFGMGEICSIHDVLMNHQKIYCECTACMSVLTDFWSWISDGNEEFMTRDPREADAVIVLGCQVTDLAVLNDIRRVEELREQNNTAEFYMGGCLAQRFDIPLPANVKRLDVVRSVGTRLDQSCRALVTWQKPFWVGHWNDDDDALAQGHLFRDAYPIKIGAGCKKTCAYCTIRDTRGDCFEIPAKQQEHEFAKCKSEEIVLISDSPTVQQVKDWCKLSKRYQKPISLRNVEPSVAAQCRPELIDAALHGVLKTLHCPIQSGNSNVLSAMHRDVVSTNEFLSFVSLLKKYGVLIATNIIIDYPVGKQIVKNMDADWLNRHFDYWSWNSYFDGHWNRMKAEERWTKYLSRK